VTHPGRQLSAGLQHEVLLADHPGVPAIGERPQSSADPATAGFRDEELASALEHIAEVLIAKGQVREQPAGRHVEQLDPACCILHDHGLVEVVKQSGHSRHKQVGNRVPVGCHRVSSPIRAHVAVRVVPNWRARGRNPRPIVARCGR
jgi:hypothetical protein